VAVLLSVEMVAFQASGQTAVTRQFEVSSIKPNGSGSGGMKFPLPSGGRFTATNVTLKVLVAFAYNVQGFEVSGVPGVPGWMSSDRYDVMAKAESGNLNNMDQYKLMLQTLLKDRFKLVAHSETREASIYALLPAKSGPKLSPADPAGCVRPDSPPPPRMPGEPIPVACGAFFTGPSSLDGRTMSMAQLANTLSIMVGRPVVDKTKIGGTFDIRIEFAPESTALARQSNPQPTDAGNPDVSGLPSIFTALQQQLGLRLDSRKGPADVLVIDGVQRPSEN
jgi:bla regulator protein blaR1